MEILIILALMVIFIPNNGQEAPFLKFLMWRAAKVKRKKAVEFTGDIQFILDMVNKHIEKNNDYEWERNGRDADFIDLKTDIDPFERYIFHGGCLSCNTPKHESISGCYDCEYYNIWDGEDRSKIYLD